jgi:ligand-binding SRPBCC domain-containing protein
LASLDTLPGVGQPAFTATTRVRLQRRHPRPSPRPPHEAESTLLPLPIEQVFDFFSKAENLQAITPPELSFRIKTPLPIVMRQGLLIDYDLKMSGIPFGWRTRITHWEPPYVFADEQLKGPYAVWFHTHTFADEGGKTRMDDEVLYKLPLWPFGEVAYPFVKSKVQRIFRYRRAKIREILGC